MLPARFILLAALGAGFWTGALASAGYILGAHFEGVEKYLGPARSAVMAALLLTYAWRVIRFTPDKSG